MKLKDMTELIGIYDAYRRLRHIIPDEEDILDEFRVIEDVIARNSALYQRDCKDVMFDMEQSEHMDVLNDRRLSAEQRAFRILGICNEA